MNFQLIILRAAEMEIWEAALFFENEKPGLGFAFLDELDHAKEKLLQHPQHYAYISAKKTLRQFSLHRFPYQIVFEVREDKIIVLAVHHEKRRPYP